MEDKIESLCKEVIEIKNLKQLREFLKKYKLKFLINGENFKKDIVEEVTGIEPVDQGHTVYIRLNHLNRFKVILGVHFNNYNFRFKQSHIDFKKDVNNLSNILIDIQLLEIEDFDRFDKYLYKILDVKNNHDIFDDLYELFEFLEIDFEYKNEVIVNYCKDEICEYCKFDLGGEDDA